MEDKGRNICHYPPNDMPTRLNISTQYADVGNVEIECCGNPTISLRAAQGSNCCCGCEITIMQTVCIKIPVTYATSADVGETVVNCKVQPNC